MLDTSALSLATPVKKRLGMPATPVAPLTPTILSTPATATRASTRIKKEPLYDDDTDSVGSFESAKSEKSLPLTPPSKEDKEDSDYDYEVSPLKGKNKRIPQEKRKRSGGGKKNSVPKAVDHLVPLIPIQRIAMSKALKEDVQAKTTPKSGKFSVTPKKENKSKTTTKSTLFPGTVEDVSLAVDAIANAVDGDVNEKGNDDKAGSTEHKERQIRELPGAAEISDYYGDNVETENEIVGLIRHGLTEHPLAEHDLGEHIVDGVDLEHHGLSQQATFTLNNSMQKELMRNQVRLQRLRDEHLKKCDQEEQEAVPGSATHTLHTQQEREVRENEIRSLQDWIYQQSRHSDSPFSGIPFNSHSLGFGASAPDSLMPFGLQNDIVQFHHGMGTFGGLLDHHQHGIGDGLGFGSSMNITQSYPHPNFDTGFSSTIGPIRNDSFSSEERASSAVTPASGYAHPSLSFGSDFSQQNAFLDGSNGLHHTFPGRFGNGGHDFTFSYNEGQPSNHGGIVDEFIDPGKIEGPPRLQ
jgi:hypothetical protein